MRCVVALLLALVLGSASGLPAAVLAAGVGAPAAAEHPDDGVDAAPDAAAPVGVATAPPLLAPGFPPAARSLRSAKGAGLAGLGRAPPRPLPAVVPVAHRSSLRGAFPWTDPSCFACRSSSCS